LDWWQELLVFSNQKGAVTAEFMLLFPTVVLALAGFLGVFQLGLVQLQLSRDAFTQARELSIGNQLQKIPNTKFRSNQDGRWVCVTAVRELPIAMEVQACLLKHGL
jgi:Flp pilus assembly protein TadG